MLERPPLKGNGEGVEPIPHPGEGGCLHLGFLHTEDAALLLLSIRVAAVAPKGWRCLVPQSVWATIRLRKPLENQAETDPLVLQPKGAPKPWLGLCLFYGPRSCSAQAAHHSKHRLRQHVLAGKLLLRRTRDPYVSL